MASKKKHQNIHTSANAVLASYEAKQAQAQALAQRKKADNKRAVIIGVAALAIAGLLQIAYFGFGPGHVDPKAASASSASPTASTTNSKLVPSPALAEARTWTGTMNVAGTDLGIELDGKAAPQAVANFVSLSKQGFFNGLKCHRLTTAGIFVLQCGDPNGDGTGGPGYNWGPIENAPTDNVYKTGVLAMARVGNNASSMGSQFFIVYKDSPIPADSVGGYTIFGKVTSGLSAVTKVAKAGVAGGGSDGKPALEAKLGAINLK
jgi:peptidyl-prolyl cis-trans isomerase B (cyclophilin B)